MAAPIGNQNAAKKDLMARMLQAALEENDRKRLRAGIEKVANAFEAGERWAVEFAFERIDGKLKQSISIETGATAEERLSTLTAILAEATGVETDTGNGRPGAERPVVSAAVFTATH